MWFVEYSHWIECFDSMMQLYILWCFWWLMSSCELEYKILFAEWYAVFLFYFKRFSLLPWIPFKEELNYSIRLNIRPPNQSRSCGNWEQNVCIFGRYWLVLFLIQCDIHCQLYVKCYQSECTVPSADRLIKVFQENVKTWLATMSRVIFQLALFLFHN